MGVDALSDLAISAVRTTFGRAVVYTAPGGAAESIDAHFIRNHESISLEHGHSVSDIAPALDVREADLAAAPVLDATVVITDLGLSFRVVDIQEGDVGSVMLILGRRAIP